MELIISHSKAFIYTISKREEKKNRKIVTIIEPENINRNHRPANKNEDGTKRQTRGTIMSQKQKNLIQIADGK